MRRFVAIVAITAGLLTTGLSAAAQASTTVGKTDPPLPCTGGYTFIQTTSPGGEYIVKSPGVLTAWSHLAGANPAPLRLKVARPAGTNTFTIIGESSLESPAPNVLATYTDIRIPVFVGDVIGFYSPTDGDCGAGTAGYEEHYVLGDAPLNSPSQFAQDNVNLRIDISATLEPDADGDGYGDETQDLCPTSSMTHGDCTPPDTTITQQPKEKSRHKQAELGFESTEPGSTFECALDGSVFAGCTSPVIFNRGVGVHVFQVRSTDVAGNLDASPALARWKVLKKKHRHHGHHHPHAT